MSSRRVVLVDFDWEDADLLPRLLRLPGIAVGLVVGESRGDPGIRAAELCGLASSHDLADLTRHIFDLALVGERSGRRMLVERLLAALGTPSAAPAAMLEPPAVPDPLPAAGVEMGGPGPGTAPVADLPGEGLGALLAGALPDLASGWEPRASNTDVEQRSEAPKPREPWLDRRAFRSRLELAIERNRREGLCFAVHLLGIGGPLVGAERLCRLLSGRLRDTDCLCRPSKRRVLVLSSGPVGSFRRLRGRLLALWARAWDEAGEAPPAPALEDHRVELERPADAEAFLAAGDAWLAPE